MRLGINTGFALNRYPLPEQWMRVVSSDLGLKYVQLTADLVNPCWGPQITNDLRERIKEGSGRYGIRIESVMTGAFTRVNHFSHPEEKVRRYWMEWFKKLGDIAVELGARDLSSHLGILCYDDLYDPSRRQHILEKTIAAWKELAAYGKEIGLETLSWEPMSIRREYGESIKEALRIQSLLEGSDIPVCVCLDVDHGDVSSNDPRDTDYREWIAAFAGKAPYIHIKQVLKDKGGHHPFTEEYNSKGKVAAAELLNALEKNGVDDALLLLELSFREREPGDSMVLAQLKESAEYWKRGMKQHLQDINPGKTN